jgi:hypothetical protein
MKALRLPLDYWSQRLAVTAAYWEISATAIDPRAIDPRALGLGVIDPKSVTGRIVVCHAMMRGCCAQLFGSACRAEPKKVGTAIRENHWPRAPFDSRLLNLRVPPMG